MMPSRIVETESTGQVVTLTPAPFDLLLLFSFPLLLLSVELEGGFWSAEMISAAFSASPYVGAIM